MQERIETVEGVRAYILQRVSEIRDEPYESRRRATQELWKLGRRVGLYPLPAVDIVGRVLDKSLQLGVHPDSAKGLDEFMPDLKREIVRELIAEGYDLRVPKKAD